MSVRITELTWKPVGTYEAQSGVPDSGTTIYLHVKLTVNKTVFFRREVETLDGVSLLDYSYPPDYAVPIGETVIDDKNYAHIPFRLGFSPFGHVYALSLEYQDVETGSVLTEKASARAFQTNEAITSGLILITTIGTTGYLVLKRGNK